MDFVGINCHSRTVVSAAGPWDPKTGGRELTDMGWEVYPDVPGPDVQVHDAARARSGSAIGTAA